MSSSNKQSGLLNRRVHEIIERNSLEKKLAQGRKLTIKFGRDPRTPILHLGHTVPLRKLRQFQLAGHQIIIVLGDFTARLGDPADNESREMLTEKEIAKNVVQVKRLFGKILDHKKTKFTYNSQWLSKLKFDEVIKLASNFTVQQNIERDLFQKRLEAGKPIGLHEFLYPVLQAYDSVELKPDLEVGGTDQTFNLLAGRTLMKNMGLPPQDILTTPMLLGTDGREMHSSWGNTISLDESPFDMFGKLMGLRDNLITLYMDLLTDMDPAEVNTIAAQLNLGATSPIEAKKILAREVVTLYHGSRDALSAQNQFEDVIQSTGVPEDRVVFPLGGTGSIVIVDLLVEARLVKSRSEARRVIEQGGVDVIQYNPKNKEILNRNSVSDLGTNVTPNSSRGLVTIVQVGKRKAVEVRL